MVTRQHLNIISNVVAEKAGKDVIPLIHYLLKNSSTSENTLAKEMNLELSFTRNHLYRLQELGILTIKKQKDESEGIYTYFWDINKQNTKMMVQKHLEDKLKEHHGSINQEKNTTYFTCENKCMKIDSDKSLELNFMCPECGSIMMEIKTDKEKIKEINNNIKTVKKEIIAIKKL